MPANLEIREEDLRNLRNALLDATAHRSAADTTVRVPVPVLRVLLASYRQAKEGRAA